MHTWRTRNAHQHVHADQSPGQTSGGAGPLELPYRHSCVSPHHPFVLEQAAVQHEAHVPVEFKKGSMHVHSALCVVHVPFSGVLGHAWSNPLAYWHVPVAGHQPLLQSEFEVHVPQS